MSASLAMHEAQKVILRCRFALGDVVLLTAAVRDLHLCYPGGFQTDVRTGFAGLWAYNPYLTRLHEYDRDVQVIDCEMPLVEQSDRAGKHALYGFLDFIGERLGLKLRLTDFRGDIHLSSEELDALSPVARLTGHDVPYWLISAGGKYDCTVKWWHPERFQAVVDHFRGRIQFVQIGRTEHLHPRLRGVIDLRGRTDVRELVNLVYHSNGVLCGVTGLMHLAAATPFKAGRAGQRPCVVVAGGREAPHWEAYPAHQFIHTVGALSCCAHGGCWKARTVPLGDGADEEAGLCVDVRAGWPHCMDLISAEEVIRRIELYLLGGTASAMSSTQAEEARQAIVWSEQQPMPVPQLNFYNAPEMAREFISRIPAYSESRFAGRGIVICGGGARMFSNAWVCLRMLRKMGCRLPVQVWYLGRQEMDPTMERLLTPLGVSCVDATALNAVWPARFNGGWALKPFAIINCPFEEVLLLDADNVPVRDPEYLFDAGPYQEHGAVLWPDVGRLTPEASAWKLFGVPFRDEPEVESGQVLVNKRKCWRPLLLCMWYNENASLFYEHIHGDKETFHFAFRRVGAPYAMTEHPCLAAPGAFYQHDFEGRRVFQHRNVEKWNLSGRNRPIPDFWHEKECLEFLHELAGQWDGQIAWLKEAQAKAAAAVALQRSKVVKLAVVMGTCPERASVRTGTLERLASVGWPIADVLVTVDERRFTVKVDSLTHTAWCALQNALATDADYVLYLEDDLAFNRHLLENLSHWGPLVRRELHFGSLCNFAYRELAWDVPGAALLVHPLKFKGSQAVLLSRQMAEHLLEHWLEGPRELDLKWGQLAAQFKQPLFVHYPSLVDHIGRQSTLGNKFMEVVDFDPLWKTSAISCSEITQARLRESSS